MQTPTVRTAIFPVAGLGTRFLPATKATPKELLPVLDTPLIQFAINEARGAGVERIVFVSHPSKDAIARHVLDDKELRETLRARGKAKLAEDLRIAALDEDTHEVIFEMQPDPLGLGHAVGLAAPHVLDGPVAVLLPDDLILGAPGCLTEMIASYRGGHMVATMEVPEAEVHKYGVLDIIGRWGNRLEARGMVEKPDAKDAPSTHAVVGRYILDAGIFDALATQKPGAGGEIQLTDAIAAGAPDLPLTGLAFTGTRFDCGMRDGMLAAQLHLARKNPELAQVLKDAVAGAAIEAGGDAKTPNLRTVPAA